MVGRFIVEKYSFCNVMLTNSRPTVLHHDSLGPWVEYPTEFSNEYATDMIEDDWTLVSHGDTWLDVMGAAELRPAPGNRQFVNKVPGKFDDEVSR